MCSYYESCLYSEKYNYTVNIAHQYILQLLLHNYIILATYHSLRLNFQ